MNEQPTSDEFEVNLQEATEDNLRLIEKLLRNNDLPYEDIPSKIHCLFLGYGSSRFVGIGGLEIHGNYGLLRSLVIAETARGMGYGKGLANKLIDYAGEKGISEIYLLTTTAESFFANRGFKKVDRNVVPPEIQRTSEFSSLCPDSAVCMMLRIAPEK
ncbi:MAG: arsenic resistance N-acetyltransferase ArsN2 [Candidatus Heimdallarchaeota archaeon]